ncbi:rod shape-determining protein MreD [Pararhodospirillum oryzae]|uniref:Rod shape-determining protein MreD n=1 Tax=Pararhodospirillum oryzae TaxID=478448 RepID=A0A512HB51_9PROT|nr:rod shape-determining protein MreD [Pararhodospirillum oryzae]GEO82672.1 rod shape-determining protein MreD [Pararhodospirillum oryzae]
MVPRGAPRGDYDPTQPTLWQRLDWLARTLVPGGLTLVMLLISVAPSRLPGFVHVTPMVALICVYYWAVTRPGALGYGTAFLLGLVEDSLTGVPLGLSSLAFLITQATVASQYKYFLGKPFLVTWWAFFLIAAGIALFKGLALSAYHGQLITMTALVFSTLLTIAMYPPFAWLLSRVSHLVFRES